MSNRKLFEYESETGYSDEIVPMLKVVPEWYKKMPKSIMIPENNIEEPTGTAKLCVPFLESMTVGYCIKLWQDVLVEQTPNGPVFRYKTGNVVGSRSPLQTDPMPVPFGYEPYYYTWIVSAAIKLPEGYSAIYTHPFNRFDLPFVTLTAVIDNDTSIPGGNSPFFLQKGFEGLIPKGTPITQVIPFKREDWVSKEVKGLAAFGRSHEKGPHDWYRKFWWRRKSYK